MRPAVLLAALLLAGCGDGQTIGTTPGGTAIQKHCDDGNLIYTTMRGIAVVPGGCRR